MGSPSGWSARTANLDRPRSFLLRFKGRQFLSLLSVLPSWACLLMDDHSGCTTSPPKAGLAEPMLGLALAHASGSLSKLRDPEACARVCVHPPDRGAGVGRPRRQAPTPKEPRADRPRVRVVSRASEPDSRSSHRCGQSQDRMPEHLPSRMPQPIQLENSLQLLLLILLLGEGRLCTYNTRLLTEFRASEISVERCCWANRNQATKLA